MKKKNNNECDHHHENEIKDDEKFSIHHHKDEDIRFCSLYGEIDPENASNVIGSMLYLREIGKVSFIPKNEEDEDEGHIQTFPIQLYVNSEGGHVPEAFAIYDIMRLVRDEHIIETIGMGKIMSAAVLILASGTKGFRSAGKHTRFMMHSVNGGMFGTLRELDVEHQEFKLAQKQYIDAIASETKMSRKKITALLKEKGDHYFNAEQALEWGIIDKVF